jgi:hypothetical protein
MATAIEPDRYEGILTQEENSQLAWIIQTDGMPAARKYLEKVLGVSVTEVRERILEDQKTNKKVKAIQAEIDRWLASKKAGEYLPTKKNEATILAYLDENNLPLTLNSLERAWYYLMAEGKLEEADGNGLNFHIGQKDPSRGIGDRVIRKSPASMNAEEFATACQESRSFRQRIDGTPIEEITVADPDARIQELRSLIRRMSPRQYEVFVSDPDNRALIDRL